MLPNTYIYTPESSYRFISMKFLIKFYPAEWYDAPVFISILILTTQIYKLKP